MERPRITAHEVQRLARLARLRLDKAEATRLAGELDRILAWASCLAELGPPAPDDDAPNGVLREDESQPGLAVDEALAMAPAVERGYFVVPRVVDE